jgi:hypothetical protein
MDTILAILEFLILSQVMTGRSRTVVPSLLCYYYYAILIVYSKSNEILNPILAHFFCDLHQTLDTDHNFFEPSRMARTNGKKGNEDSNPWPQALLYHFCQVSPPQRRGTRRSGAVMKESNFIKNSTFDTIISVRSRGGIFDNWRSFNTSIRHVTMGTTSCQRFGSPTRGNLISRFRRAPPADKRGSHSGTWSSHGPNSGWRGKQRRLPLPKHRDFHGTKPPISGSTRILWGFHIDTDLG